MITAEKLLIYQRYNGDMDNLSRARDPHDMNMVTDEDWRTINILWHRLALEQNVPCAESFRAETRRLLSEQVADAATELQFRQLAAA